MILRAPEPEDIEFIYQCENDPERLLHGRVGLPYSRESIRRYVEHYADEAILSGAVRFIVEDLGRTCGITDLYDIDNSARRAFLSVYISPHYRRKGLGAEALVMTCDFARDHLGLTQLNAIVADDNAISIKLFKKTGFFDVAVLPQWVRKSNGDLGDALLFSKIFEV